MMIEELGMASLFKKRSMWSSKVTIIRIDGGINSTEDANSDDDSDEAEEAEETLKSQDSFKKTYALMKQSKYLMT